MSRQVDIKALVSHIVRGDGSDKCRICMGDTTEGQVHLEDTVMMDGDKPVTLAELLEIITGVEVELDPALPCGLCRSCSDNTLAAVTFRNLCALSAHHWEEGSNYISQICTPTEEDKAYFIFYNEQKTIVRDQIGRVLTKKHAVERLNMKYQAKSEKTRKPRRPNTEKASCKCPDCGKKFSTPDNLNYHFRNSPKRACRVCHVVLHKKKLAKHLEVHGIDVVQCQICHKVLKNEALVKQHVTDNHGAGSYCCGVCGNGYWNERALRSHSHSHSLFHCKTCNLSFENLKCFIHHRNHCAIPDQSPIELNSFTCDYCGATYNLKPSLRIHIIQKHLNVLPYVCQVCGKRTSTLAHLKSHEKVHKTERQIFECYCGAKLRTEIGFQLHKRIHTGEKPYKCEQCGERFISSSRRLDHVKRQHRGRQHLKHACEQCSARFVRPCELKKHYLTVHYTVVDVKPAKREINPLTKRLRNKNAQHMV